MYAQDSIELLNNSGMDFKRHEDEGIEIPEIAELLISSGLVLCDNVGWITFHSGYDFGYLLKLLTCQNLPVEESEFFDLLRLYFPKVYDVKYIMKSCKNLKGGLQEVCYWLCVVFSDVACSGTGPDISCLCLGNILCKSVSEWSCVRCCVLCAQLCAMLCPFIGGRYTGDRAHRGEASGRLRQQPDRRCVLQNETDVLRGRDRR